MSWFQPSTQQRQQQESAPGIHFSNDKTSHSVVGGGRAAHSAPEPASAPPMTTPHARPPAPQREESAPPPPPAPPSAPVPVRAFSQISHMAKDVLYGNRAEGIFAPGTNKMSLASVTAGGATMTTTWSISESATAASGQTLIAMPATKAGWAADVLLASGGVAEATVSRALRLPPPGGWASAGNGSGNGGRPAAGAGSTLKLGAIVALPAPGSAPVPKVTADYSGRYLYVRSTATCQARPLLTASAVVGSGQVVVGGEASYSTASRALTRWSAAAGWHGRGQQLGLLLGGSGSAATLSYALGVADGVTLGAEVTSDVKAPSAGGPRAPPALAIGASFKLSELQAAQQQQQQGSGSSGGSSGVVKVNLDSRGQLSVLFKDALTAGPRVTLTVQIDATNLSKKPRLGICLDV